MGSLSADAFDRRAILHVDMDSFFVAVELLDQPELRGRPVIVGGDGARGVVASCSYEARRYGIHSAMPSARARRLCPQAIFLGGRYGLYEQYSRQMHDVFADFTPVIEPIALDEAFLDVTGAQRLFGSPENIGWQIRRRLQDELNLTASVGVASTKHLAKLASKAAKPKVSRRQIDEGKGVFVVTEKEALKFLQALPVRALWGVGPKAAERLEVLGMHSVKDVARMPLNELQRQFGEAQAAHLHGLAWNQDERPVEVEREAKSVGHERTFPVDLHGYDELHEHVVRMADAVATRLRTSGMLARTLTVKVRFGDFRTLTRAFTFTVPTAHAGDLAHQARVLLEKLNLNSDDVGVRLLGLSTSKFSEAGVSEAGIGEQLSFGDFGGDGPADPADADSAGAGQGDHVDARIIDSVIDGIRAKFGSNAVMPALLVSTSGEGVLDKGERQWGPSRIDERRVRSKNAKPDVNGP